MEARNKDLSWQFRLLQDHLTLKMRNIMYSLKLVAVLLLTATVAICNGCSSEEAQKTETKQLKATIKQQDQKLVLTSFWPQEVKAGEGFNVQPNGGSALGAAGHGITPSTIIVINEVKLHGFNPDKRDNKITTPVPKEIYARAGEYPIYLFDTKTGAKSNELKFVVK